MKKYTRTNHYINGEKRTWEPDLEGTEKLSGIKLTKGQKHLWHYFEEIIRTEDFKSFIRKIREKYKIPEGGYNSNDWGAIYQAAPENSHVNNPAISKKFDKEISEKCKQIALISEHWGAEIYQLIVWNVLTGPLTDGHIMHTLDVCSILTDNLVDDPNKINEGAKMYPIILGINPYASGKEIIDFIKKNNKRIKELQEKYIQKDIKINKVRKKDIKIQQRNDFIYNLSKKGFSISKISEELSKKTKEFGDFPDYGAIGKIISIERKKRT